MIGRADIEGSKSNVAVNAWLPQASYPCGNFSDTSRWTTFMPKGSIGHAFTVPIYTGNENEISYPPSSQHKISVLFELTLGHLRYDLTDVPPQPNSPPNYVFPENKIYMHKTFYIKSLYKDSLLENSWNNIKSSGISGLVHLPLILHPLSNLTNSD